MACCSECCNDPTVFIKYGRFLDSLMNCKRLKDCAPWGQLVS